MRNPLSSFPLLRFAATWLLFLFGQSDAKGNVASHVFERLILWEQYNIAVALALSTASEQTDILPFNKQGGQVATNNRGTGPGEMLRYTEFMVRLEGKSLDMDNMPKLTEPGPGRSVEKAASELMSIRYQGRLNPKIIYPNVTKVQKKYNSKDPKRTPYTIVVDRLENMTTEARISGKVPSVLDEARISRMKEMSEAVMIIRSEDTTNYTQEALRKLKLTHVVANLVESAHKLGPIYHIVDLDTGYDANKEALKKSQINSLEDLTLWVENLGNPAFTGNGKEMFTESNFSHFRVMKSWEVVDTNLRRTPEELATGGRVRVI